MLVEMSVYCDDVWLSFFLKVVENLVCSVFRVVEVMIIVWLFLEFELDVLGVDVVNGVCD